MTSCYDLVIVGAGLMGTSLALALQRQGLRIALLEKHLPDFSTQRTGDDRPISLNYGSKQILTALGVWQDLQQHARAIDEVQVSEQGVFGGVHFKAVDYAKEALGFVLPYTLLYKTLYQAAASQAGVDIICIEKLIEISKSAAGVTLTTVHDNQTADLTAKLVVGCDGARSTVRELAGIKTKESRNKEVAIAAKLEFACDYPAVALERFSANGVLAILPLADKHKAGLVWTLKENRSQEITEWSEERFVAEINKNFRGRIPTLKKVTRGQVYPLQTVIAKQQLQKGVVLLGNAAHTIYPLAAQGFNLGLRDAAVLAEVLATAEKLYDERTLQHYYELRAKDQRRIIRLTSSLTQLFSAKLPLLRGLRGLGMLAVDVAQPVKEQLAKLTMGLGGRLPKLVQGTPLWNE